MPKSTKTKTLWAQGHSKALQQVHAQCQTVGLSRMKGQTILDGFYQMVTENNSTPGHPLHQLQIKNEHSKIGNKHENNHAYSSGIHKIAKKEEAALTPEEKV